MKKIELLAPAGSLYKLKIAVLYGADAVYIGGEKFSLRARANNFSLNDLKDGVRFAHKHHSKVYVTMNVLPHNSDLDGLDEYLSYLEKIHVDGVIVTSMVIFSKAKSYPKLVFHISTQASVINSDAIKYYASLGAKRVVLGREASLNEIKMIKDKCDTPIEVFIHGGMCASCSGRCILSNHMANRDANRGGCAHSCRWNYDLYDGDNKINQEDYLHLGSKDLNAMHYIPKLIDLGVDSLKIEGRMKSEYYIATIIKTYRMLIDEYYNNHTVKDYSIYEQEIKKAENRETGIGFFEGRVTLNESLYLRDEVPTKEFIGVVKKYNRFSKTAIIEQRNYFKIGDTIEVFGPNIDNKTFVNSKMSDLDNNLITVAPHPKEIIKVYIPFVVRENDMLRLKK